MPPCFHDILRMNTLRTLRICAALLSLTIASVVWAEPHLKSIKIAVSNPTDQNRAAENIVLSVSDLRKVAPDFYAGSHIVTATQAATVAEDAAVLRADEVPSQVDDIDGGLKPDELAFQIDLKPHQTRIVTITWGPAGSHFSFTRRLRAADQRPLHEEDRRHGLGVEARFLPSLF